MSWNLILFLLILGLPLLGAAVALLLRRFLRDRAVVLVAALAVFLAGVAVILLVELAPPGGELGETLPPRSTAQAALQEATTARWVQPPRTLPLTATLAIGGTPTPTPPLTATPTPNPIAQVSITVRNGTGESGLAGRTAQRLNAQGFHVIDTSNDPQSGDRPHTLILDRGDHAEVRQRLAQFLQVEAEYIEINSDEPGEADIIVILGDDFEE